MDYDGDGAWISSRVGDWTDYGWDDAYNEKGEWTNGPLKDGSNLGTEANTIKRQIKAADKTWKYLVRAKFWRL